MSTRYPLRSHMNRAQNNGDVATAASKNNDRPSERTRSQPDRLGVAQSQTLPDYTRVLPPTSQLSQATHSQAQNGPANQQPQPKAPRHNTNTNTNTNINTNTTTITTNTNTNNNTTPNPTPNTNTNTNTAIYPNPTIQTSRQLMMSNGSSISMAAYSAAVNNNVQLQFRGNNTLASSQHPSIIHPPILSSAMRQEIKFIKLNSYDDQKVLISPRRITMSYHTSSCFKVEDAMPILKDQNYRVFLRFCKNSTAGIEQNDCLPKAFNLIINQAAFQVKNRYLFAPYDITTRIACEKSNDVQIRISLDTTSKEVNDDFIYGLFLVKKVDHRILLENFKKKPPYDARYSIEMAMRKLNPTDDSDEIAIIENSNQIKVQLLCPLSSTLIKIPARSKYCDHVHCFDAESFININAITPRWRCPICKIFIKLDDMVIDGFFLQILRNAPKRCVEAEILPDGHFEYIYDFSKSNGGTASSTLIDASGSSCSKRTFEEDCKDSVIVGPIKAQKTVTEIECITIEDSSDESSDSDTNTLPNSDSPDNQEKSDDEISIVYEKIVPRNASNSTLNATSTCKPIPNPVLAASSSGSIGIPNLAQRFSSGNATNSAGNNSSSNPPSMPYFPTVNSNFNIMAFKNGTASLNNTESLHRPTPYTGQPSTAHPCQQGSSTLNSSGPPMINNYPGFNATYGGPASTISAYGAMKYKLVGRGGSSMNTNYSPHSNNYSNTAATATASYDMTNNSDSNADRSGNHMINLNNSPYSSNFNMNYITGLSSSTMPSQRDDLSAYISQEPNCYLNSNRNHY